jgi:hypothetical protein
MKAELSVGSIATLGDLKLLAPRRLRLRALDCLRLGWPMILGRVEKGSVGKSFLQSLQWKNQTFFKFDRKMFLKIDCCQ